MTLVTDHKLLVGVFSSTKPISPQASGRNKRWAFILQAYLFILTHLSGSLLGTADALSRIPLATLIDNIPVPSDWTLLVNFLD